MKLTELFTATGEPFSYYPGFVGQFDISVNACVMLCFIAWKTFPDELGGWKPMSSETIRQATGLSTKEQVTARRQLVEAGLVEEFYARLDHEMRFKILPKEVAGFSPNPETAFPETPKGSLGNTPKGVSTKGLEGDKKGSKETTSAFAEASTSDSPVKNLKRELTDSWCAEFNKAHGFKYDFRGVIDGKAADRFLKSKITTQEIISVAKQAWKRPSGFQCKMAATLAGLQSKWNEIRQELTTPETKPGRFTRPPVNICQPWGSPL